MFLIPPVNSRTEIEENTPEKLTNASLLSRASQFGTYFFVVHIEIIVKSNSGHIQRFAFDSIT